MSAAVDALGHFGYTAAALRVPASSARARRFYERTGWATGRAVKEDGRHGFAIREVRYRRVLTGTHFNTGAAGPVTIDFAETRPRSSLVTNSGQVWRTGIMRT